MSKATGNPSRLFNRSAVKRATLILIGVAGAAASLVALARTDDDPVGALVEQWPVVIAALLLYMVGMSVYSVSWAILFPTEDDRALIALGFIVSQPIKYLPGGVAQPIGQVTLAAQAAEDSGRAIVSFPVHVLINVVAALTLSSPMLFIADLPSWAGWVILLIPITWAALNRRWMVSLISLLGRLSKRFRVSEDLPTQRAINNGFGLALIAHGAMFLAFGVLTSPSIPGWSPLELAFAFGGAWMIGYVAIPAPAGLGAREAVLVFILAGAASTVDVVKISAVHRIATLVVELALLLGALIATQAVLKRRNNHVLRPPERAPSHNWATDDD